MLNIIKYRKKEVLIIIFILAFALIATYNIYYKFNNSESTDYNTNTLDVTYNKKNGDQINITKITSIKVLYILFPFPFSVITLKPPFDLSSFIVIYVSIIYN